ncbi:MAG: DUF3883 domain-containing protein [Propionibacterium sp.]|nr:DUF3883 domain-containing protein [Propionibacterium sp.]
MLGQRYVKTEANRRVVELTGRSRGSVERKFQNISAVLLSLGAIPIHGYKPLKNVQHALKGIVAERFLADSSLQQLMRTSIDEPVAPRVDFAWNVTRPPVVGLDHFFSDAPARTPLKIDFVKRESQRRDLGRAGEEAVVAFERQRLRAIGQDRLARMVEHVSQTKGDGLGYDVLSFDKLGQEQFIEVKTTRNSLDYPFYLTRNEVELSVEVPDQFQLYRVYDFTKPKIGLYTLPGSLRETCNMTPTAWLAGPH